MSFASIYQQLPGGLVDLTLFEPSDGRPKAGKAAHVGAQGEGPRVTANPWTSPTGAWTYHHSHITDMPCKEGAGKEGEAASRRKPAEGRGRVRKIVPVWQVGKLAGASTAHDFSLPSAPSEDDV